MATRGPTLAGVAIVAALIAIALLVAHALGPHPATKPKRPWPWDGSAPAAR